MEPAPSLGHRPSSRSYGVVKGDQFSRHLDSISRWDLPELAYLCTRRQADHEPVLGGIRFPLSQAVIALPNRRGVSSPSRVAWQESRAEAWESLQRFGQTHRRCPHTSGGDGPWSWRLRAIARLFHSMVLVRNRAIRSRTMDGKIMSEVGHAASDSASMERNLPCTKGP